MSRSLFALALLATIPAQAQQVNLAIAGCSATAPAFDFFDPFDEEVTFLALGDSQYGYALAPGNAAVISAMNQAPNLVWPTIRVDTETFIDGVPLTNVRGVIVAGDITHDNTNAQWNQFAGAYGLCANETLNYPVYEGWGNHDIVTPGTNTWDPDPHLIGDPAVADYVALRNPFRPLIDAAAGGTAGHYRWAWRDLNFIQLNLEPSDMARGALSFLAQQLAILGPDAPVIVISHYGFDSWSGQPDAMQDAYDAVIRDHNVVAHLHGHDHATSTYTWSTPNPGANSYAVPMFNLGSPVWDVPGPRTGHSTGDQHVHFTAFRITPDFIIACDVRAAPVHPFTPEFTPAAQGGWCRAVAR